MKVVINRSDGGFSLSEEAVQYILDKHNKAMNVYDADRSDPALIDAVETLGKKANGGNAELKIVEVPDDVKWHIEEYDGKEWVAEDHNCGYKIVVYW